MRLNCGNNNLPRNYNRGGVTLAKPFSLSLFLLSPSLSLFLSPYIAVRMEILECARRRGTKEGIELKSGPSCLG